MLKIIFTETYLKHGHVISNHFSDCIEYICGPFY